MSQKPIYLDYNASTPIAPAVANEMLPYLHEHFGNPSSAHSFGAIARMAVEKARARVASLIGAKPDEIIFTSGGSEANNMVIFGVARALRQKGRHIITSAVEHPAVIEPCRVLAREGFKLTVLPVNKDCQVSVSDLEAAITPETILISIMHANNEVGTVQPVEQIAAVAAKHEIVVHTDAAQSCGKIDVDVNQLGVDLLSIAGHKLYGPQGIGALYIRSGRSVPSLIHGAGHEGGRRAGTENVLEVVGLGKACDLARQNLKANQDHCREMRDRLWDRLSKTLDEVQRNGDPDNSLPNTLSVSFRGVDASTLLAEISDRVAISAGAACHADEVDLSAVLEAMQIPLDWAMGTVRFSVGNPTTVDEIDSAASTVAASVTRLGGKGPVQASEPDGDKIRLTRFTKGMGCACKLRPNDLEQILEKLPVGEDSAVLVDMASADDAAVYKVRDDLALVQTVDFFTPIVDDPYEFGAISAANSLSDIYAMGANPIFALSIVAFPTQRLPLTVLSSILEGASDTARLAGVSIIGGHSVEDSEPKFGLAVCGLVHPDQVLTNSGAQAEDVLVLTKPLGVGIISTGVKRGVAAPGVEALALATMKTLNKSAAEAMSTVEVHACTDVTGFGLLGHLHEMIRGSGLDVELDFDKVPILDGVRELAAGDVIPGGTIDNLAFVSPHVDWSPDRSRVDQVILADAQTSGGLLIAVPARYAESLIEKLQIAGVDEAAVIGRFCNAGDGRIAV